MWLNSCDIGDPLSGANIRLRYYETNSVTAPVLPVLDDLATAAGNRSPYRVKDELGHRGLSSLTDAYSVEESASDQVPLDFPDSESTGSTASMTPSKAAAKRRLLALSQPLRAREKVRDLLVCYWILNIAQCWPGVVDVYGSPGI
jgi:hypothetical protein